MLKKKRGRKTWLMPAFIFGLVYLGGITPGRAADTNADATEAVKEDRSSFLLDDWPLQRVIDFISRRSKRYNIRLLESDPEIREEILRKPVTIELQGVTWRSALKYLAKQEKFIIDSSSEADGIIYLEKPPRVTIDVRDTDITQVIKLIAADSSQNIIIGPEVTGQVTFNITDVPWMDALDAILKTMGFVKVVEPSGIIRITTVGRVAENMETRTIRLRYVQPGGNYYEARTGKKSTSNTFVVRRGSATGTSPLDQSLIAALNTVKSPDGIVTYESVTNMLILRDTAPRLADMVAMIEDIDRPPRQVKIETRVLTQRTNPTSSVGVNWVNGFQASVTGGQYSSSFPFSAPGRDRTDPGAFKKSLSGLFGVLAPVTGTGSGPIRVSSRNPVATIPDSAYTLGVVDYTTLKATLDYLAKDTNTKILQAPEIVALDNQEATVFIGSVRRYALLQSEATDFGSTQTIVQRELLVGMQLIVIPHICGDTDNVIIEIVPKEEETPIFSDVNVGGVSVTLPTRSDVKIAHTKMMLKSSETGVIAGLLKRQSNETFTRIPMISRLPVVGHLFKHKASDKSVENTIIMVTPFIISENHGADFNKRVESLKDKLSAEMVVPELR